MKAIARASGAARNTVRNTVLNFRNDSPLTIANALHSGVDINV
jgi:hypothetical protein